MCRRTIGRASERRREECPSDAELCADSAALDCRLTLPGDTRGLDSLFDPEARPEGRIESSLRPGDGERLLGLFEPETRAALGDGERLFCPESLADTGARRGRCFFGD